MFTKFDVNLVARLDLERILAFTRPCRPRILVVTDSLLSFRTDDAFGLGRFLHGLTVGSGVTLEPILTLAYRGGTHPTPSVTIGADTYAVQSSFDFASASPAVTLASYDQVWIFGFAQGGALSPAEIATLSEFMNGGGGVFATGDHGAIGSTIGASLPRARHMREWSSVPMGGESDVTQAVERIDTVVNPGANDLYEFEDQSDDLPQRIYPRYRVSASAANATQWEARVHPLLMLPGAPALRAESSGNAGFTRDVDVLPDHPHESVCYDVKTPAALAGTYTLGGQSYDEFRPSAASPAVRLSPEIVAYAVSGGRSVRNGVWKPPVRPQMFGVVSAYDGRLASAYPGKAQRPGRIVCDSTWHHYVNVNLDGVGTGRSGLGTWSGGGPLSGTFTPGPALEKIYGYYRNIASWLQPANRVRCRLFWELAEARLSPSLLEELLEVPRLEGWRDHVGLGREAARLIAAARGSEAPRELVTGALLASPETEALGELLAGDALAETSLDGGELVDGILGAMMARTAGLLPADDPDGLANALEGGPERHVKALLAAAVRVAALGLEHQARRAEKAVALARERLQRTKR